MTSTIRRISPRQVSTVRPKLTYIPWKTKEEILSLHEEDATRWNASTLSTRFGAARENVEALLRLGAIRKQREKMLQSLEQDKRERIVKAREKAINSWKQLVESVPKGISRTPARPSELKDSATDVTGKAHVKDDATGASANDVQESAAEEVEKVRNSSWADHVEKEIDNFESDVERKTTYAFIEIGDEKEGLRRAVWLRQSNGKMRIADEAERRLFLNKDRARDSPVWRS